MWKEKPKKDIPLDVVGNLFNSKSLSKNVDLSLTGGEPFMHKNLMDIVRLIFRKSQNALKTISTNGTFKNKIAKFLNEFINYLPDDFSLHISLDGVNKHDEQRAKSLKSILGTIKLINERFNCINVKLKFTITPINYNDIIPTYEFAKINNLGFKIKLIENAVNYTNKISAPPFYFNKEMKKTVAESLLRIYKEEKGKGKKEAFFIKKTIEFLFGKNQRTVCRAPFERIFIMSNGEVYSCIHFPPIGSLNDNDLDKIWRSKEAEFIRSKVLKDGCGRCVSYHGFNMY
jgi:MoaA/NifB/PqqE/SkfB family radical SAM enzyme